MRKQNEVPPERTTLGRPGISIVFDMFGPRSDRNSSLVVSNQVNITVTDRALEQIDEICSRNNTPVVRYELQGGGCSGLIAKWGVDSEYSSEEGDGTWSIGDNRFFVIDKFTLSYMDGATIDYTGDFMPQFKVTIPDRASCGCGESFVA